MTLILFGPQDKLYIILKIKIIKTLYVKIKKLHRIDHEKKDTKCCHVFLLKDICLILYYMHFQTAKTQQYLLINLTNYPLFKII